ncbi:MAG: extracellular solute-binding protein, partial [Clostridia bacterium]|nr:extracellular solute-binding protein [Clostridia bacterium]
MAKRIISLLLIALLCVSLTLVTSCGDNGSTSSEAPSGGTGEESEDDTAKLQLPEKNWGGQTVSLLTLKNGGRNFSETVIPSELTNEPINDAFFDRNALIEERYGIKLELITCANANEGLSMVQQDMDSGMQEINIVSLPLTYIAPFGVDGLLYDITSIENGYIHYDSPWWDQAGVRDLTINGKLWFLAGDALVEDDECTWAFYFNKDLVGSYQLESPYDIVERGEWTLDTMHEMAKKVHFMNGSQMSYDPADNDVWGLVCQSYDTYMFMLGAGQPMVESSSGLPAFRVVEEENVRTFDTVMSIMNDADNVGVADHFG